MKIKYWEGMKCPYCGKAGRKLWYNDVPLKAFCWGTEEKEHKEWSMICKNNIYT